jgi:hypothetical protein
VLSAASQIIPKPGKHHLRETPHQVEKQQAMVHSVEDLLTWPPFSIWSMTKLENSTKFVTVEWPFMKPCCKTEICGRMIGVITSQLIFSKSFGITDKMDIPRKQEISRFLLLEIGPTKASFSNIRKNTSR